jgi:Tfp pilus assembly protein PilV
VTLPETLIALVILLVVVVAVLSLFSYAMRLNVTGRQYAGLTACARDTAEMVLALPWSDPRLAAGVHEGGRFSDGKVVLWRVEESRVDASAAVPLSDSGFGESNLKEISVTCLGTDAVGLGRRDVTVVVLRARP